jgi:hypothetical protein
VLKKTLIFKFFLVLFLAGPILHASKILVPMDAEGQKDHLKAYGMAYQVLELNLEVYWLLNYRGGSFLLPYTPGIEKECKLKGITYQVIAESQAEQILAEISSPALNMEAVKLEKAPRIAVYSPKTAQPWDDAVTLVLTYAEIPYDVIYDAEVLADALAEYDWLHLHHEDFTGQYGRFYSSFKNAPWYIEQKRESEASAQALGFQKVSDLKGAVAEKIKQYVMGGGFMFAMCSATDSYDIALAAAGLDICEPMFDGDGVTPGYAQKLNFDRCLAFTDFQLSTNPNEYEFSNIDVTTTRQVNMADDYFTLFEFSAKWDVVPTMLTQNHTQIVKGFMGQTTAFRKSLIKPHVLIMGELTTAGEARYIHGELEQGTWTFYGGHDPEDYQHRVGDPPTDLALYPHSPGYRLILNNVLFPAARKKKQKT